MITTTPGGYINWTPDPLLKQVGFAVDKRMIAMGRKMVETAKKLAPVKTGRLQRGIVYHYHVARKELVLVADAPYSEFQEFGTVHFRAHPFIRPAISEAARFWHDSSMPGFGPTFGMGFFHTPRLKGQHAKRPGNTKQLGITEHNRQMSRGYNYKHGGNAKHYRRSIGGGYGS